MNHTTKTKTTIIILRILLVLLLCISSLQLYADNYVYVCTGKKAKKYHYSGECTWMKENCQGDIKKIKESEAIRIKKYVGLCRYCAKNYTPIPCPDTDSSTSQSFVEPKQQESPKQKHQKSRSKKIDIGKFKN